MVRDLAEIPFRAVFASTETFGEVSLPFVSAFAQQQSQKHRITEW